MHPTERKGGMKLLSVKIVKYLLGKYLKAIYIGFYKGYIKIYNCTNIILLTTTMYSQCVYKQIQWNLDNLN